MRFTLALSDKCTNFIDTAQSNPSWTNVVNLNEPMADNEIVRPMFDCWLTQTSQSMVMVKIELLCIEMFNNDKKVSLEPSSSLFLDDYKNIHVDKRFFMYIFSVTKTIK